MTYQEHYRAEAEDNGEVLGAGRPVEVATGHYTGAPDE